METGKMKLQEAIGFWVLSIIAIIVIMMLFQACSKEIRYVRHGEPCNDAIYDCQHLDTVK
jgi:hypothetical protein